MFRRIYKLLKTVALILDISKEGIMVPLVVFEDGSVLDGHTRLRIARYLGIEQIPVIRITGQIEHVSLTDLKESY